MGKDAFINHVYSVTYTDRKEPITGIILAYSDDWMLMRYNPVDYVLDGYVIIRNKNLDTFKREEKEIFAEKILRLKEKTETPDVPLDNLETILQYLTEKYEVFKFYTKSENRCYLGDLKSIDSRELWIRFFDARAKWYAPRKFRPGDVRVIEFDTDYINSLKLLSASRKRTKKQTT